jgi:hypothetical protein
VAAGLEHTCALTSGGAVECWGINTYGQLGDGTTMSSSTPVAVSGLSSGAVAISAGTYHTCAVLSDGTARCWGDNTNGELGNGTTTSSLVPVTVTLDDDLSIGTVSDITAAATGASGTKVTFTAPAATDEGSETPSVVCDPSSGSTFPLGSTTVTCTASDADDSPSSVQTTFSVTVTDSDLALVNVSASITVDATGPSGAVVSYTKPTVVDEETPLPIVSCSPATGSTFAIGTTQVGCSASDSDDANSPATASFNVTVKGAAAQLQDLLTYATGLPPGTSLVSKIQTAIAYYQAGKKSSACSELNQVISEANAQKGKHLTAAQASEIIAEATNIKKVIGC